jgi:ABC-2 type transport system ATP-binding protein
MNEYVIQIEGLHVRYGKHEVLGGVDLNIPKGSIFGFLGRNGAGKTTTIKTLLGLLTPTAGSCRVLGIDVPKQPLEVRKRVGYMAEDQQMYGWMTVEEIINWVGSFYPKWDSTFIAHLREVLQLDPKQKVKNLSKGQNSKLALLLALGHHPELVILDDPTLGLDPIARKEFLRYVISLLQNEGITVFFSSHLLYEIEPVADYIAILDKGKIIKADKTIDLRDSVRRLIIETTNTCDWRQIEGLLDMTANGDTRRIAITVENCTPDKKVKIQTMGKLIREVPLNLDEIFEAYVIGNRGERKTL